MPTPCRCAAHPRLALSQHGPLAPQLASAVAARGRAAQVTLGPKGRNVVLSKKFGAPEIINDGVTIARDIVLSDPGAMVGAQLVQQVAQQSDNSAGDGTTTSAMLTQEFVNQGMKASRERAKRGERTREE